MLKGRQNSWGMIDSTVEFWAKTAKRYPVLPYETHLQLARQIQSEPEGSPAKTKAVNKLCVHNLRLVLKFVSKFQEGRKRGRTHTSEQTVDLLQQGYIGLKRAAELYDPTLGYAFSTYAMRWIQQAVLRYNAKDKVIAIPENMTREWVYKHKNGHFRDGVKRFVIENMDYVDKVFSIASLDTSHHCDTDEKVQDIHETLSVEHSLTYVDQDYDNDDVAVGQLREKFDLLLEVLADSKFALTADEMEFFSHYRQSEYCEWPFSWLNEQQARERRKFYRVMQKIKKGVQYISL